jgi:hypothetical protein
MTMASHARVTGSNDLDLAGIPASSAEHLRRIIVARAGVEEAHTELRLAVEAARDAGESWAMIAVAMHARLPGRASPGSRMRPAGRTASGA